MRWVLFVLAFATFHFSNAGHPLSDRTIHGCLIVTSDPKIAEKLDDRLSLGKGQGAVTKAFPGDRFKIVEWGRQSLIIVDMQSGPLGMLAERVRLGEALLAETPKDGVFLLRETSRGTRDRIWSELGKRDPALADQKEPTGAVGLDVSISMRLQSGDQWRDFSVTVRGDEWRKTRSRLQQNPIPQESASPRQMQDWLSRQREQDQIGLSFGFHFRGTAMQFVEEGMKEATTVLERTLAELRVREVEVNRNLLSKLGVDGGSLLSGEARFDQLPEKLRKNLESQFLASYQGLRFGSEAEARSFLYSSQGTASVGIGLTRCLRPASGGRPALLATIIFTSTKP